LKDNIIDKAVTGILIVLVILIVGDYIIAYSDGRAINEKIINLIHITIAGLIGIIGTYYGTKNNKK
tara:strand:+ start:2039 stop:2236 length:198 start_codon:yes stop_codon:yes gene_type:complete